MEGITQPQYMKIFKHAHIISQHYYTVQTERRYILTHTKDESPF